MQQIFWIENAPPPPPLEVFRKFIRFGTLTRDFGWKSHFAANIWPESASDRMQCREHSQIKSPLASVKLPRISLSFHTFKASSQNLAFKPNQALKTTFVLVLGYRNWSLMSGVPPHPAIISKYDRLGSWVKNTSLLCCPFLTSLEKSLKTQLRSRVIGCQLTSAWITVPMPATRTLSCSVGEETGHKLCGPQPGHYWSTHSTPPTLSTHLHSPKTYPGSLKVPLFNKTK